MKPIGDLCRLRRAASYAVRIRTVAIAANHPDRRARCEPPCEAVRRPGWQHIDDTTARAELADFLDDLRERKLLR